MKFTRYENTSDFGADTLEILLENEVQNNLPLSFIYNERGYDTSNWLMASVKDDNGSVILTAACTPPFNIVLYETGNKPCDAAVKLLSDELKSMDFILPGVLSEEGLANRFAQAYAGEGRFHRHMSEVIMRLDKVNDIPKAPGHCRPLCEDDLFYLPYWLRSFGEECQTEVSDVQTWVKTLHGRIGSVTLCHYIWENGHPVSSAHNARNTPNGGGINAVYTPPHYRGNGYASSNVAELSKALLERGHKFCFLFANAENPISCGIYRKLGYADQCVFGEIKFGN